MKKIIILASFILVFALTASAALINVSMGKSYTLSAKPASAYPDDGKMLTDGVHGTMTSGSYHKSGTYVGIPATSLDKNGLYSVTVDLGEVKNDLNGFDLYYAVETDANVYAPEYTEVAVSENGSSFTVVGKVMSGETNKAGTVKSGVTTLRLSKGVSARYVRLTIKNPMEPNSCWMFIDEVTVLWDDGKTPDMGDTLTAPILFTVGTLSAWGGFKVLRKRK